MRPVRELQNLVVAEAVNTLRLHVDAAAKHIVGTLPGSASGIDEILDMLAQRGRHHIDLGPQRWIIADIGKLEFE